MLALPRRSFSRRSTWPRVASVAALALCVVGYFMSPSKVLGSEAKGVRRSQSLDMSRLASMERLERLGRLRGGDSGRTGVLEAERRQILWVHVCAGVGLEDTSLVF
eukprot:1315086-Amorphochlora_amoeboformis.AAC.1